MCFRHFGWFKTSFHLAQNLWLPSGPSYILLTLSFFSSIIVPHSLISPHPLLWIMRHSPAHDQILLCFFMLRLSRECLQTLAYNLPVELVGVSLLMDRSVSIEEDFWQWKCHMARIGESSHMSKIFLGKKINWDKLASFSIWLCDVMDRCSSYCTVFVIRVSLISVLRPLRSLSFVLRRKFLYDGRLS